jgi:hypothetical protein
MKRLALLATALLLASPALANGVDRPRTKRTYVERHAPVVVHRCQAVPSAMYDSYATPPFRSHVWRGVPARYTFPCAPYRHSWRRYGFFFR